MADEIIIRKTIAFWTIEFWSTKESEKLFDHQFNLINVEMPNLPIIGQEWKVFIKGKGYNTRVHKIEVNRTDFATQTTDQKEAITNHINMIVFLIDQQNS